MFHAGLSHRLAGLAGLAGCALLAPLALAGPAAAAGRTASNPAGPEIGFAAAAYGSSAILGVGGATLGSSPSAPASFPFATTPETDSNSTLSVSIPALSTTLSGISDTVSSSFGRIPAATARSTTAGISLLGGLVKASAIREVATTSDDSGKWAGSSTATLAGLTIAGKSITIKAPRNTAIPLPGVGAVYLNYQKKTTTSNGLSVQADAILVDVTTANSLGVPVGSQIVVGYTLATGAGPLSGTLGGGSYGTSLTGGLVTSGPSFPASVPPEGTGGKTYTESGLSVTAGPLSTGVISDTAEGTDTATTLNARTSATIADVSVAGVLTVDLIKATASAAQVNGKAVLSGGVTLTNLKVAGVSGLPANPAPNYTVSLPGGGTLVLNRQVKSAEGIQEQAVYLSLPVVGTLVIGSASASFGP